MSVLVEAGSEPAIPVSCVEQGRRRSESEAFVGASHAGHPALRRRKAERLASAPLASGAARDEVWDEVADKTSRLGVRSSTGANADAYAHRRVDLDALAAVFPLQAGQCGAVLALAGAPVCLDLVSRPEAFIRLYPKLLAGYLLDAIEHLDGARGPGGGHRRLRRGLRRAGAPRAGGRRATAAGGRRGRSRVPAGASVDNRHERSGRRPRTAMQLTVRTMTPAPAPGAAR